MSYTPIRGPDATVEAVKAAMSNPMTDDAIRAIFDIGLRAWPGMKHWPRFEAFATPVVPEHVILPIEKPKS